MYKPKILDIQVDWREHVLNDPELKILLDRFAESDRFLYTKDGGIYYAEFGAVVRFYAHFGKTPEENQGGFGGARFELTMIDGTKITLVGPWTSRAGAVHSQGFGPCLDVSLTDDPEVMKRGHTFSVGHVTVKSVQEWIRENRKKLDWELKPQVDGRGRELTWVPVKLKD